MAKVMASCLYPFVLLYALLLMSLAAGAFFGFDAFQGGTGVGTSGLVGMGLMTPRAALLELVRAYTIAAYSLLPISLLALLASVLLMRASAGALAALAAIIVMRLLIVFPNLEPYLLTSQLDAYVRESRSLLTSMLYVAMHMLVFITAAVLAFDRKDV
jgi:ABC-2 type transport system permease protein